MTEPVTAVEEEDCAVHHQHTADCAWHWGDECTRCLVVARKGRTGCGVCVAAEIENA